jgi:hypothetical protein
MCAGCLSAGTALVIQGSMVIALAHGAVRRLRHHREGRDTQARLCAVYQMNAEFVAGLGLDPGSVLGPPPGQSRAPERTQSMIRLADRVPVRGAR